MEDVKKQRLIRYKEKLGIVLNGYFIPLETLKNWVKRKWTEYYEEDGLSIDFIENNNDEELETYIKAKYEDNEIDILWMDYIEEEKEEYDEMAPYVFFRLPPKE